MVTQECVFSDKTVRNFKKVVIIKVRIMAAVGRRSLKLGWNTGGGSRVNGKVMILDLGVNKFYWGQPYDNSLSNTFVYKDLSICTLYFIIQKIKHVLD